MSENSKMSNSIKDVKTQHEERLLQLPGVVSVGIGQDEKGNQAIIVGLERPDPETESQLPTLLEGYPVVVRQCWMKATTWWDFCLPEAIPAPL